MRPGLARQSRMRSQTIAKKPIRVTPAFSMRRLASSASLTSKVPLASVLAKTSYPSSMSDRARKAVPNHNVIRAGISRERAYSLTNFSDDTTNDQLLLAKGLDSLAEVRVIPGVDLTLATDEGSVGVHLGDLLEQEAVGATVGGGGQDGRQIKDVANGRVGQHVVAEVVGAEVSNELGQTDLVIDDQESLESSLILIIEAAISVLGDLPHSPCRDGSMPERERRLPAAGQSG